MVQIAVEWGVRGVRGERRRLEILRAASEVFRERGFHGARMRDIAARLGIAVGKLYYWFDSKEALLAFCQERALTSLIRSATATRGLAESAARRLHRLLAGHLRCLHEEIPGSLAHLEIESLGDEARAPILRQRRRYENLVTDLVKTGIADGEFRATDPMVAGRTLLGAVNWSAKWYRPEGRMKMKDLVMHMVDPLVRGLLVDPAGFVAPPEPATQGVEEPCLSTRNT